MVDWLKWFGGEHRRVALIVEDEPLLSMMSAEFFDELGYQTLEVHTCEAAIGNLLQRPDIVVVFSDIQMPGYMSGLDLSHRIHEDRPDIQVVLVSGQITPSRRELPPGVRFLPKPFTIEQVKAALSH